MELQRNSTIFNLPQLYTVRGRTWTWSLDFLDFKVLVFFLNCSVSASILCVMAMGFLLTAGPWVTM
jgi:hypothetical protein